MRRHTLFLLSLAVLCTPRTAAAQEPPVVIVGEPDAPRPPILVVLELTSPAPTPSPSPSPSPGPAPLPLPAPEGDEPEPAFVLHPVSLGLSGLVGTHDGTNGLAPTWTAGLDVGFRLHDLVALGVRRVTAAATAQGRDQWAIGLSPYVELAGRVAERVELYGQLGAALEVRAGFGTGVGVAPFTGGGVRFFVADLFSIAVEGAAHVPVTDTFLLGHEVFPLGAVILQGGLALAFHLG